MTKLLKLFLALTLGLLPIGAQATNFLSDPYTDTAGTVLSSHTAPGGFTWTHNTNSGNTAVITINPSGDLIWTGTAGVSAIYDSSATPPTANYGATATVNVLTGGLTTVPGVMVRAQTSSDTGYAWAYDQGAGGFIIVKRVSGTVSVLATYSGFTPSVGTPYTEALEVTGNTLVGKINGSTVETYTDSSSPITAAGVPAVLMVDNTNQTSTTGSHLQAFSAYAINGYTLTGPTSGNVNVASTNFTVTPISNVTDTITPASTGSGTFSPTSLSWSGTSNAQTFTYTPTSTAGSPHTISTTSSPFLGDPAGIAYTVNGSSATTYTLTGPSTATDGTASSNFTVTPNASYTGVITPASTGSGTFSPTSLTFTASSSPQTFTYTPTSSVGSPHTISTTSSPALTNPASLNVTISPGAITLTSPTQYQTFQRHGVTGTIAIAGTNGDTVAHSIQASFNGGTYQTIASNVAGGATFSGTLTSQSQGQGTLTARFADITSDSASISTVGIGDIYVIAGQSNAVGQIQTNQLTYNQKFVATMFALNYTWEAASDPIFNSTGQVDSVPNNNGSGTSGKAGTYWMTLATYLEAVNGVPVAFIPAAQDGAGLASAQSGSGYQWTIPTNHQDRTTLYGAMVYRAKLVGGVAAVLWHQGETDAINGNTASQYSPALVNFGQNVNTDLGVPVYAAIFQTCTAASPTLSAQQAIWTGIRQAAATPNSNIILGPNLSVLSADSPDGLHLYNQTDAFQASALWAQSLGVVNHRWTH